MKLLSIKLTQLHGIGITQLGGQVIHQVSHQAALVKVYNLYAPNLVPYFSNGGGGGEVFT